MAHIRGVQFFRELCDEGQLFEALRIIQEVTPLVVSVHTHIICFLLQGCIKLKDLSVGREVHAMIIQNGLESNTFLGSYLIRMFALCGSLLEANLVFSKLPYPNVFAWSEIISAQAKHGDNSQAIELYNIMPYSIVQPDGCVYVAALKACASAKALHQGRQIHVHIVSSGCKSDVFVENTLINMYAKCGALEDARLVFDNLKERDVISWSAIISGYAQHGSGPEVLQLLKEMQRTGLQPNIVTWNAVMSGYAQHGFSEEALYLFNRMLEGGKKPDSITYVSVLKACANIAALAQGMLIHNDIIKSGLGSDMFIRSILIDMYAKCGNLDDAHRVFDEFPKQNTVTWSSMIAAYALHHDYKTVFRYFEGMRQQELKPNDVTFVCILSACSHMGLVDEGFHHFDTMRIVHGITPTVEHYNCMLDLLGRAGLFSKAKEFLDSMPCQPNIVGWTSLLNSCRIYGNVELGRRCFDQILRLDCRDASGYALMSTLYGNVGMWDEVSMSAQLKKSMNAWKKPGSAYIEVDGKPQIFVMGGGIHPFKDALLAKLMRLSLKMKEEGHLPDVDSVLQLVA